ncbi:MAG: asparagine synthase (glutamine-hydrolyzing) [Pseudomonadota bacterium]|nr:asparagine synthase (glutamine-hydrolyzing) [Pseudomonadota bacterium]
MCGFFGLLKTGPLSPDDIIRSRQSRDSLAHRGPDGADEHVTDRMYLGHRRLSIIDLSDHALQPFVSGDRRFVLVFNGEIYNYVELREKLRALGFRFRTDSDTEVLLNAFIHWNENALTHLDGMFAGSFHDLQQDRHIFFRDALGQKPFYYSSQDGNWVFASELRAILHYQPHRLTLDLPSARRYLLQSYYAWADTPVSGVHKLPPGHLLILEGRRQASLRRWWNSRAGEERADFSPDQALEKFSGLFDESCRIALRSDVPVGVFLSGGIDSTLVAAHALRHSQKICMLSIGSSDPEFNETDKALASAAHLRSLGYRFEHETLVLDTETAQNLVLEVLQKQDEPHGDPGYVNAFFLARAARSYLTVALAGDGADELFYGYLPFLAARYGRLLNILPDCVTDMLRRIVRHIPAGDGYVGLQFRLLGLLRGAVGDRNYAPSGWLSTLDPRAFAALAGKKYTSPAAHRSFLTDPNMFFGGSIRQTMQQKLADYYQQSFLPEFVCHHTDRAFMLQGLEVRAPFLSPSLIAFANRLPDNLKCRGNTLKWLLREHARRLGFPLSITTQKKQGFTFPVARWLRGPLAHLLTPLTASAEWHSNSLDQESIRQLVGEHMSGKANHYRILYNLLSFYHWRLRYPSLEISGHDQS